MVVLAEAVYLAVVRISLFIGSYFV